MPFQSAHASRLGAALLLLALGGACERSSSGDASPRIAQRDLSELRWIAGDWRGSGTEGTTQAPFFERYVFADDSTLLVLSFPDSTWSAANDTSRYELRGGRFENTGSSRWAATRMDSASVDFVPVARTRNGFRWAREAGSGQQPTSWKATITWTDTTGARRDRHYLMERAAPRR